jgi:hypothetical protein
VDESDAAQPLASDFREGKNPAGIFLSDRILPNMMSSRIFGVLLTGLVVLNAAVPDYTALSLPAAASLLSSPVRSPAYAFFVAGPVDDQAGLVKVLERAALTAFLLLLFLLFAGTAVSLRSPRPGGRFDSGISARSPPLVPATLRFPL